MDEKEPGQNPGRRSQDEVAKATEKLITEIDDILRKLKGYFEEKRNLETRMLLEWEMLHASYAQTKRNIDVYVKLLQAKIDKLEDRGYIEKAQKYEDRLVDMQHESPDDTGED